MHWLERWRALARRIDGLLQAGEYMASAFQHDSNDHYDVVGKALKPEHAEVDKEIKSFLAGHRKELPEEAVKAADAYLNAGWSTRPVSPGDQRTYVKVLAPLDVFRAQFDYFARDTEVEMRSLVELAFEHLRRRIAVDKPYAKQWLNAFSKDEPQCERLGAVHLLSHGIWAFKIDTLGAATDLVLPEPLTSEIPTIERTARTLVLTEWKRITTNSEIRPKADLARAQARIYASSILPTLELKRTRYLVLVSQKDLNPPDDVIDNGITYRHVVVPVSPSSPSKTARNLAST